VDSHNILEVVPIPRADGILSLKYWVDSPQVSNNLIRSTTISHISVCRMVSKTIEPPYEVWRVFYMSQSIGMPVNQVLLRFSTGAKDYRLLQENILVVKAYQNTPDLFRNLTELNTEDCDDLIKKVCCWHC
jgi:hypothetical protein